MPPSWGCCAFAGDRGLLHPELTGSATAARAKEVRAYAADAHTSSNRTRESPRPFTAPRPDWSAAG
ncbi:hypothetical protein GCM10009579_85390 [Streptomyces javensis]|uniref:Uncharacterized protein n=1 Tax=Streptomyces javensis TaxID=114698 RepID=A0ABN1XDI7_9ACTN